MRTRLALTAASVLLLASACGSSDAPEAEPAADVPSTASNSSGEATTIFGSVGSTDNPESFDINLTDADGNTLTELPAGAYEIQVADPATIHNFHLTGPGVDVQTDVQGTGDETFEVTLEVGDYDYVCDPHTSSMNGSFRVS